MFLRNIARSIVLPRRRKFLGCFLVTTRWLPVVCAPQSLWTLTTAFTDYEHNLYEHYIWTSNPLFLKSHCV